MTEATSSLLNRPLRTQAEVIRQREIRDEEMQGGRNGDATTDACDMLTHMADRLDTIRQGMIAYGDALLGDYICALADMIDDMGTQRQRIEEEERNNR